MKSPVFFKTYNSNQIHEGDSFYYIDTGIMDGKSMIPTVEFFNQKNVPDAVLVHQYFNRYENTTGGKIYLVKTGDILYKVLKDTKLARITHPNAIEHKGWLLIG